MGLSYQLCKTPATEFNSPFINIASIDIKSDNRSGVGVPALILHVS